MVVHDSPRNGDRANLSSCGERVEVVPFTLGTDDPSRLGAIMTGADHLFELAAEKHNQSSCVMIAYGCRLLRAPLILS